MTTASYLIDLPEAELKEVKNRLIADGLLVESKKFPNGDAQFFERVTLANILLKYFLFLALGLYFLGNLAAIIFAIVKDTLVNPFNNIIGLLAICFIVYAIFRNINTKRQQKENLIALQNSHFIFNFCDGVVATKDWFYWLPADTLQKIEFVIYGQKQGQIFAEVTFTFVVLGYQVQHRLRYTNLSLLADALSEQLPTWRNLLTVDGQGVQPTEKPRHLKCYLMAAGCLLAGVLLLAIPYALHYYRVALTTAGVIMLLTAGLVVLASGVKLCQLGAGLVVSGVFIIMGFCVPLLVVEISSTPLWQYLLSDSEILLPTVFGLIGLCLLAYSCVLLGEKIVYQIKRRHRTDEVF